MAIRASSVPTAAFTAAMLVCILVAGRHTTATITCEQVVVFLTPCIGYGVFGGTVPPECCAGMKGLNAASNTTEDRRTACNCVQAGAANIPGLNYDRVNTLPDICGTDCPYRLGTNCSSVN